MNREHGYAETSYLFQYRYKYRYLFQYRYKNNF